MSILSLILLAQSAAFGTAALVHSGVLVRGYKHRQAAHAETVIAAVLLAGSMFILLRPSAAARAAAAVQSFALCGTLIGIFTMVIGVGPRTIPDVAFHVCIVSALLCGLFSPVYLRRHNQRPADVSSSS